MGFLKHQEVSAHDLLRFEGEPIVSDMEKKLAKGGRADVFVNMGA